MPDTSSTPQQMRAQTAVISAIGVADLPLNAKYKSLIGLRSDPESLEEAQSAAQGFKSEARICFVTPELVEFDQNGGLGTATSGLIALLRRSGYDITVLYTGWAPALDQEKNHATWIKGKAKLQAAGVGFRALRQIYEDRFSETLRATSYAVFDFLNSESFQVVHFNDFNANGFYSCLAKRAGTAFASTKLVLTVHGPKKWAMEANSEFIADFDNLEQSFLENSSIENCDVLVCLSERLGDWLTEQKIRLPDETYLHKNIQPVVASSIDGSFGPGELKKIVFFGRLEERKGIRHFVSGSKKFLKEHPSVSVEFLGRFSRLEGEHAASYVLHEYSDLPNSIGFKYNLARDEALNSLRGRGTLAVIPSVDENSPCVVVECQLAGVPYLASHVGGIPELVLTEDQSRVLCAPTAVGVESALKRVWSEGAKTSAVGVSLEEIEAGWLFLHSKLVLETQNSRNSNLTKGKDSKPDLVSVCITHFNRPWMLNDLIDAIAAQTYSNIEIVLVDDGSTLKSADGVLESIAKRNSKKLPITVVRIPNSYLGAARNAAVKRAKGVYVKFQDDDNLPLEQEVEMMVGALKRTGAAVATAIAYQFRGAITPATASVNSVKYFPLGSVASGLAFIRNEYGDANALVRKTIFNEVGGFSEERGVGYEDYEFFAKCASLGHEIILIPNPLFYYRVSDNSMLQSGSVIKDARRGLRGFDSFPAENLRVFAEISHAQKVAEEVRVKTWYRLGGYQHSELHQQLLTGDPTSQENLHRLVELMASSDRIEDALKFMLRTGSVSKALSWMGTSENTRVANFRNSAEPGRLSVIDLSKPIRFDRIAPLNAEMSGLWPPDWELVTTNSEGLLIHPVGQLTTIVCLSAMVRPGARKVTVRWLHIGEGQPAEVSIAIGTPTTMETEWMVVESGSGPCDVVVELPPSDEVKDLFLMTRAVENFAAVWIHASMVRIDYEA